MTCIAGVVQDGKVWIGGDSAGVAGWSLQVRADPKVFKTGPFVMGFTSSFRMGQLLAHSFHPPARHVAQDIYAYMVTDFISAVRDCLKTGGFAERNNEVEKGGVFLVGYEGRLFTIQEDYQVSENIESFAACGSGDQLALGAMFCCPHLEPRIRILAALTAAERFNAGVRGPFHIIESDPLEPNSEGSG